MLRNILLQRKAATILLVEDERGAPSKMAPILRSKGYRVLQARTPEAAFQIGSRHDGQIDLLLTEATLPGLYGWQLAELMKLDYPHLRVLYITDVSGDDAQEFIDSSDSFLHKPFRDHDLVLAVSQALDEHVIARSHLLF